jgi:hypothetical protein
MRWSGWRIPWVITIGVGLFLMILNFDNGGDFGVWLWRIGVLTLLIASIWWLVQYTRSELI